MPIEKKGKIINTPSSGSTDDNAVVRWDGTSSNSLQNSEIQIDDTGNIYPNTNNAQDLGISGTNEFKDLYLSGNAIIGGDLTVQGNSTTVNTATLDVEDVNITVNKNGNDASSEGAGLTVERTSTNGSIVYEDALTSKWKCGAEGAEAEILNKNNDTDDLQEGSTNLYFTEERAQDSVGNILVDSSTIDFTYDDGTPSITADVIASAIEHGDLAGLGDDDHPQYYQVVGRSGEDLTITAANIYWDGDGSGNIGAQGGPGRPDAIHAISAITLGNATTRMEPDYLYISEKVVIDGNAEAVQGTTTLTLESQGGDLTLVSSGIVVCDDNLQLNAQVYSPINALTPGANISTDCNEGNVHSVTLDQNSTLDDPSNLQAGATYTWIITQDSTPRTLSFGSAFKFPGGVAPIMSVGSGAVDIISGVSDGTNVYVVAQQDFQ